MKYYDMETYWQWMAIEMPMEREEEYEEMTKREHNVVFDLSGRKIECIKKPGLYVVNGRKVIIR